MKTKIFLSVLITAFSIPSIGFCLDWSKLETKIQDIITNTPMGRHSIETEYEDDGSLTVSGYVATDADKQNILQKLSSISGVSNVVDKLEVKQSSQGGGSDSEDALRKKVLDKIQDEILKDGYEIQLEVSGQDVTIKGVASTVDVIKKIGAAAKKVSGVKSVKNLVVLQAEPSDDEIKKRILKAFSSESDLQADDIVIEVVHGVVTLQGNKSSHRVVDRILSVANMVDGVKEVKSKIEIN